MASFALSRSLKKSFYKVALNLTLGLVSLSVSSPTLASPHHFRMLSERAAVTPACVFPDGTSPAKKPDIHCYNPSQFMKAYGIDQLHDKQIKGKGQVIILVDSFGSPTMQEDLDHFSDTFNLPRTQIQFVYPNGAYVNPLSNADQVGWAQETSLDLEWAHAVAPEATLVNVITNNSETTGLTGLPDLFKGIQMAVADYPGAVVSMSFGTGEPTFTLDDIKTYLQGSFHQVLQQGTFADMTFLASAGDSGSTDLNTAQTSMIAYPNASYPASDPLITSVGGTALEAGWTWDPQGTALDYWNCVIQKNANCPTDFLHYVQSEGKVTETIWKEDWAVAAGGGGISAIFPLPRYQKDLDSPAQKMLKNHRGVPDLAMNAAVNGGVDVYTSFSAPKFGAKGPTWEQYGGTSCASPETAGLIALAGQVASSKLGRHVGVGFLNPVLYSLKNRDFNDIVGQTFGDQRQVVIDDNSLFFNPAVLKALGPTKVPPVPVAGLETTKGYDLATGRGSPKAYNFVLDIAKARIHRDDINLP